MKKSDLPSPPPSDPPNGDLTEMPTELASTALPAARGPLDGHATPPTIPDHELLRCIGRGSYGEVWLARNVMGTYRAVKLVYRDAFESDRPYEREFTGIQKFEPISRRHESQVDTLHIGRNDPAGYFHYVMELADDATGVASDRLEIISEQPRDGIPQTRDHVSLVASYSPKTLRSELKQRGRLPSDECLEIALSLTTALEHLHAHGLIHRDIKPANIIFVERPGAGVPGGCAAARTHQSRCRRAGHLRVESPPFFTATI
jgi:serine/threonine protein kinase